MSRLSLLYSIMSIAFLTSCSTIGVLPREGTPAKFNLATVEYVNAKSRAQQEELIQQIVPKIHLILDSLLVKDRNKISRLDSLLIEQQKRLRFVTSSLDSTNATVEMVSGKLVRDISEIRSTARDMQMYVDQLRANMESLPVVALRELNAALEQYLSRKSQEEQETGLPIKPDK